MMLTISMYSSHSLAVRYFDSSDSVNMSSFICSACNSTYDSTSCIVVLQESRSSQRSAVASSSTGTLSLDNDNSVSNKLHSKSV